MTQTTMTTYFPDLFKPSQMLDEDGEYDSSYDPSWDELWPIIKAHHGFTDEQAEYVAPLFRYWYNTTDREGGVLPSSQHLIED